MVRIAGRGSDLFGERTGASIAESEHRNVRLDWPGQVVTLASRNLVPDPGFVRRDEEGNPEGWDELRAAPAPDSWNLYLRRLTRFEGGNHVNVRGTRLARQNSADLSYKRRTTYLHAGPVLKGGWAPDRQGSIAPPQEACEVKVVDRAGQGGYRPGVIGLRFRGLLKEDQGREGLYTAPGPVAFATLSQGQSCRVYCPEQVPEDWTHLVVEMTPPSASEAAALAAGFFGQRVLDLSRGLPLYVALTGPFRKDEQGPLGNETFVGGVAQHGPPSHRIDEAFFSLVAMTVKISWSFRTARGWSAQQGIKQITVPDRSRAALYWSPPKPRPAGALEWRPEFEGHDTHWYTLAGHGFGTLGLPFDVPAQLYTNKTAEEDWPGTRVRPEQIERVFEDATGVSDEAGGVAAPEVEVYGETSPPPGRYQVAATLSSDLAPGAQDESAAGPRTTFVLPEASPGSGTTNHTFLVRRPALSGSNRLPNARHVNEDRTGLDEGWETITGAGLQTTVEAGLAQTNDTSTSTTNANIRTSPPVEVNTARRYSVSLRGEIDRYVSGTVRWYLRHEDASGATLREDQLASLAGVGATERLEFTVGPGAPGAPSDFGFPNGTAAMRLVRRHLGSIGGPRNLRVLDSFQGVFRGGAVPPARKPSTDGPGGGGGNGPGPSGAGEASKNPRPGAGLCWIVRPAHAEEYLPAPLTGRGLAMLEYYGPPGTPPTGAYGLRGLAIACSPGAHVLSMWIYHRGVDGECSPLRSVFRDRRGRILRSNPSPFGDVSGNSGWTRRHIALTAPRETSYLQFVGSPMSDGLVRLAGVAFERDEAGTGAPTIFTDAHEASGWVRVVIDTEVPGSDIRMPGGYQNGVAAILRSAVQATDAADGEVGGFGGTSVEVQWQSGASRSGPWSSWHSRARDTPANRYLRAQATLSTSDLSRTPELRSIFVDIRRPVPALLALDGSEIEPGGCEVLSFDPPQDAPNVSETVLGSGRVRRYEMGDPRTRMALSLRCWHPDCAASIAALSQGKGAFVLEGWGERHVIELDEVFFEMASQGGAALAHRQNDPLDRPFWRALVTETEAEVLESDSW